MEKKSVEKNYIYNLIYQMLIVVIPLITTPYVSRVLSADGIGVFSYTTAMTGYFALFGNLGVATYGQLKIAGLRNDKKELSKAFHELIILRFFLMFCALAAFLIFVKFISKEDNSKMYLVLTIQIIAAMLDITWFLQGLEEFKKIVVRNTIIKILSVVLIFLLVKNPKHIYLYAFIMNASTLAGNASIWFFAPKFICRVKLRSLKPFSHLKQCITYFIPTIATTIYLTLDKTMIGWFTDTNLENGYYEQAHKIEQMTVTVVTSLSIVTMPRMAYLFKTNKIEHLKNRLNQTIKFILFLSIPMCFGMMAVSDHFIPLYLGKGFEKSVSLLKIFSLLLVVVGLNNAVGKQVLMPVGRQNKYNIGVIVGAIVNFVLNLLLIPHFYSIGAAIASVAAETSILLIFIKYSQDYITLGQIVKDSIKYLIAGAIMFAAIRASYIFLAMSWANLVLQILCGSIVYLAAVLVLRDSFIYHAIDIGLIKLKEKFK